MHATPRRKSSRSSSSPPSCSVILFPRSSSSYSLSLLLLPFLPLPFVSPSFLSPVPPVPLLAADSLSCTSAGSGMCNAGGSEGGKKKRPEAFCAHHPPCIFAGRVQSKQARAASRKGAFRGTSLLRSTPALQAERSGIMSSPKYIIAGLFRPRSHSPLAADPSFALVPWQGGRCRYPRPPPAS